jgi:hypothetical protein
MSNGNGHPCADIFTLNRVVSTMKKEAACISERVPISKPSEEGRLELTSKCNNAVFVTELRRFGDNVLQC